MIAKIIISGVAEAETTAREILAHVEEIKRLQANAAYKGINIVVDVTEEAASCN